MNKNVIIFNSLNKKNKNDFIGSCFAKKLNSYGVPRTFLKKIDLKNFLSQSLGHFKKIDDLFFEMICDEGLEEFLEDKDKPVFDYCRIDFRLDDELFNKLDNDKKKLFNLYLRNFEKDKFIISNSEHLNKKNLSITKAIEEKLLSIWQSKWCCSENYTNFDCSTLDNIIYD